MRVAIPSDDQSTIAPHFGRAKGFLVYRLEVEAVELEGYRLLADWQPVCACAAGERPSRHQRVLDGLAGCDSVIARGMGAHMYDDLSSCGIEVFLTDVEDARAAVELLRTKSLPELPEIGCEGVR